MTLRIQLSIFVVSALSCAACDPGLGGAVTTGETARGARAWNARAWNARAWNARAWNARAWNGSSLGAGGIDGAGWRAEGLDGRVFDATTLSLQGSTLLIGGIDVASLGGSVLISPVGLPELLLRIDGPSALVDAQGLPRGIDTYEVWASTDVGWEPMFVEPSGAPLASIPLAGEWETSEAAMGTSAGGMWRDEGRITFGARGFVLAKCVELGYRPWGAVPSDLHRACVRMLRADYCGDGRTWTADGTMLNVYDASGIQARETSSPYPADPTWRWSLEAEWTQDGAVCLDDYRIYHAADALPACATGLAVDVLSVRRCGFANPSFFGVYGTARIMSEFARQDAIVADATKLAKDTKLNKVELRVAQ